MRMYAYRLFFRILLRDKRFQRDDLRNQIKIVRFIRTPIYSNDAQERYR